MDYIKIIETNLVHTTLDATTPIIQSMLATDGEFIAPIRSLRKGL